MSATERRIVAALSRSLIRAETVDELKKSVDSELDWDSLLGIAAEWELEPIVLSNLRTLFSTSIPDAVLRRVETRERETRAWTVAKSLVTMELAGALEEAGIPTIVLKGPVVGIIAYGDVSLRTFSDVDLLVAPNNLAAAARCLTALGYKRDYDVALEPILASHGHALEFSNGRNKIEVHGQLLPRHLRFDVQWEEILAGSQRLPIGAGHIRALGTDQLLLFLCAHGAKHMWSNVRWIADVANLVDRLDAEGARRTIALSRRTHTRRLLALGLRRAQGYFGCDLSLFPDRLLSPRRETEKLEVRLRSAGSASAPSRLDGVHPNVAGLRFWIECRERSVDKTLCAVSVIFLPTEKDKGAGPIRWVYRPLRLGARLIQTILG